MQNSTIHLVECPRDAMQGWTQIIPTAKKVEYLDALLGVGFHTIDFGSFVSAKAIPQMADTKEVIHQLDVSGSKTNLLAIVANLRGAEEAVAFNAISHLGFPFSVSETFQQKNTNSSIQDSLDTVKAIQQLCISKNKKLVVYLSMAFGNPYGDVYNQDIVFDWGRKFADLGIGILSLADTVGLATPAQVGDMTGYLVNALPETEIGVHLHSSAINRKSKIEAAFKAGCFRFDGALKGIGGCPMAENELVGNINTELLINYFNELKVLHPLNEEALMKSIQLAEEIFETK
jgi:hydroxymethylglutaryl-CoA lyase